MERGPFGPRPGGVFNTEIETPGAAIYWDPIPHRIRAIFAKQVIVDSTNVKMLHETGHLPVYYFPEQDLRADLLEPSQKATHCPFKGDATYRSIRVGDRVAQDAVWAYREPIDATSFLAGHAALVWDAIDEWFVEDEQAFGHPRDPYSRIDVYPTARHVRVLLDGEVLADTHRAMILFESALPPRYYIPQDDVRLELLETSSKKTRCAYKGSASYSHVRLGDTLHEDIVWIYRQPQHDAERVRDMLAFFNEHVDIEIDGERLSRPVTGFALGTE